MPATARIENILEALADLLDDATLATAVGTRIYNAVAAQNDTFPLIVYQIVEAPLSEYFGGRIQLELLIDIDIYAKVDVGSAATTGVGFIEDLVYSIMHGVEDTSVTDFQRVRFIVQTRGARVVEEEALRSTMRVRALATTT